jgi:hypothetical protein
MRRAPCAPTHEPTQGAAGLPLHLWNVHDKTRRGGAGATHMRIGGGGCALCAHAVCVRRRR